MPKSFVIWHVLQLQTPRSARLAFDCLRLVFGVRATMPQRRSPARHLFPSLCFEVVLSPCRSLSFFSSQSPKPPKPRLRRSRRPGPAPTSSRPRREASGLVFFGGLLLSAQPAVRSPNSGKSVVLGFRVIRVSGFEVFSADTRYSGSEWLGCDIGKVLSTRAPVAQAL